MIGQVPYRNYLICEIKYQSTNASYGEKNVILLTKELQHLTTSL